VYTANHAGGEPIVPSILEVVLAGSIRDRKLRAVEPGSRGRFTFAVVQSSQRRVVMKRVLYASVIALACTIAVAAQGGGAADQGKDKGGKMGKDAGKSVTLTGCVAESGGHFMLNNATGEAGSGNYALSGGNLKAHVGHKVEVTGALKPAATSGKDAGKKDTMAKGDAKKDDMASAGTVSVKDVKMVAASCS
jgi:hypothetical protein